MVLMSTTVKKFSRGFIIFALIVIFNFIALGQSLEVRVKILSLKPALARIEGNFSSNLGATSFSFSDTIADAVNLSQRIKNFQAFDERKREIKISTIAPGEFRLETKASSFSYQINLETPENVLTAAHVSWISENYGLLAASDFLPKFENDLSTKLTFELPTKWEISTVEKEFGEKIFVTDNIEKAVFLIGNNLRRRENLISGTNIKFFTGGDWQFSDDEANQAINEIINEYERIFGAIPTKKINVFLLPVPREVGFERWRAETRGSTVTILSAPTTFKSSAFQRLHEQLRHELFHLWIPNNLNLSGDYAWFYEGFAQYAALKTGVALNQIRFEDFLNTVEQAYDLSNRRSEPIALLEASKFRWNGENSSVYAKGLIVAFLCDVALMRSGNGDINKIFREIYEKHGNTNQRQDGSTAILNILKSYKELNPVIERHIKAANKLIWETDFDQTGIEKSSGKLKVKAKASRREKDLLNKLGYNNWRKLLRK